MNPHPAGTSTWSPSSPGRCPSLPQPSSHSPEFWSLRIISSCLIWNYLPIWIFGRSSFLLLFCISDMMTLQSSLPDVPATTTSYWGLESSALSSTTTPAWGPLDTTCLVSRQGDCSAPWPGGGGRPPRRGTSPFAPPGGLLPRPPGHWGRLENYFSWHLETTHHGLGGDVANVQLGPVLPEVTDRHPELTIFIVHKTQPLLVLLNDRKRCSKLKHLTSATSFQVTWPSEYSPVHSNPIDLGAKI